MLDDDEKIDWWIGAPAFVVWLVATLLLCAFHSRLGYMMGHNEGVAAVVLLQEEELLARHGLPVPQDRIVHPEPAD